MTGPRFIEIDGKRHLWRDLVRLRREQKQAFAKAAQPALFELRDDARLPSDRTAAGRYLEPSRAGGMNMPTSDLRVYNLCPGRRVEAGEPFSKGLQPAAASVATFQSPLPQ